MRCGLVAQHQPSGNSGKGPENNKLKTFNDHDNCIKAPRCKQDPMLRVKTIINPTREKNDSKTSKSDGQGFPFSHSNGKGPRRLLLAPQNGSAVSEF